ncbi:response regulator transcription factor [Sneathiella sp.]|uniref:response regulator transcription factor n=1 Tax=Sneathiella sp. TaxID=1964365 RepID=UPI002631A40A|nr:response regulator transcription factor [Sneathiella sp.]MDF2368233.1 response regulator transcription factor [Sneathiella sp.]
MSKGFVLSIDDDDALQVVLSAYFESEGYLYDSTRDGSELAEKLNTMQPDIILLDLVLSDVDGTSLIPIIRQHTQAPIIIVSGKNDTTEKIICLEMGADDYLTKPFELRELKARIKAAMRRTGEGEFVASDPSETESENENITFGEFTLDRDQYQVFKDDGESLDVTIGEFQLLEALVTAPNRALSREQLFELTRDGEYDSYDRAIDIQIGRIRKKLGEDGLSIIKTMRGIGYMYCPPD